MDSFVYRWRNVQTRQWYIGYHKGTDTDGYICSSAIARPAIQHNPEQWQRRILRRGTKQQMVELERRLLQRLNARHNPQSLNRSNNDGAITGGRISRWTQLGYDFTQMSAKQIAEHYYQELQAGNPERIWLCNEWILNRVSSKPHRKTK